MRQGSIDLDLSTQEFLTDPDFTPKNGVFSSDTLARIEAGDHIVRDGLADSGWTKAGGHAGGRPLRISRDRYSGKMFVRVAEQIATEPATTAHERHTEKIKAWKPFHLAGSGYWIPLDELFPNHPHSKLFNGS